MLGGIYGKGCESEGGDGVGGVDVFVCVKLVVFPDHQRVMELCRGVCDGIHPYGGFGGGGWVAVLKWGC